MLSRRKFLRASGLAVLSLGLKGCSSSLPKNILVPQIAPEPQNYSTKTGYYDFESVAPALIADLEVPQGYNYQVLASFGDNLFADNNSDNFDLLNPLNSTTPITNCFGYNNDYCAYFPINESSEHGILCVNHETVNLELMFAPEILKNNYKKCLEIALNSLGHSVFEVKKEQNKWQIIKNSRFNRRITPQNTVCLLKGYAAGNTRIKSRDLPFGQVLGTIANRSGGKTPWNTVLTAEENFDSFFGGDFSSGKEAANFNSLNFKSQSKKGWEKYFARFNLKQNPREANSFGYIVEIDPFDAKKSPIKHTSLGRFKHESAMPFLDKSGRIVVYMGDDEAFEHLYKFVSKNIFDEKNHPSNSDLLDNGTLFVAKFFDDGSLRWLPLLYGHNGLNEKNGFFSQGDICIETRRAAKILGATQLDRPEGIAISPIDQKIYVSLTNNLNRVFTDKINRDAPNIHGYILEVDQEQNHLNNEAKWRILLQASQNKTKSGLSNPDNLTFDKEGNLWVATDGMPRSRQVSDSVFKIDIKSGKMQRFLNSPNGCEICSPEFTPNNKTLFLNIQHPGEDSDFFNPSTRWPKFDSNLPPLPSLVVIEKTT